MQKYFAIKNKNNKVRLNSSSGGLFFELAKFVIEKNGIVYGAIYDDNNNVKHYRTDKLEDITKFSGSKYVKSELGNTINEVKKDLENDKIVLFSGTPCQVLAVKNSNKGKEAKLILVDVVCHGTIKKCFFEDYKRFIEKKYKTKIKSINMRYKDEKTFNSNIKRKSVKKYTLINKYYMKIDFINQKRYLCSSDYDPYYVMFDLMIDNSCFKCPFANLNRVSDLTIGDFHEFNTKLGNFNDNNGVSLLIINTIKGKELFEKIKKQFVFIEKEKEEIIQPPLQKALDEPARYKEFNEDYKKRGFNYCVKKYVTHNYRLQIRKIADGLGLLKVYLSMKNKIKKSNS